MDFVPTDQKGETGRAAVPARATETTAPDTGPPGERRQVTVLFCDILGSTSLSEQLDPEEYSDLVRLFHATCTTVIERRNGYIAQHLGDGVLVYFGYPQAHEDDGQQALHAALEIIAALQRLASRTTPLQRIDARIGIHTGIVVINEVGSGARSEMLALGETPNIAARLQGVAPANSIVISEHLKRLTGGMFSYADLGEVTLKGISHAVRLHQVLGIRRVATRYEAFNPVASTSMVGREPETNLLLTHWERVRQGTGHTVLIKGEPGIGKSRIAIEAIRAMGLDRQNVVRLQCSSFHTQSALHPIIETFERAMNFAGEESNADRLDRLEALIIRRFGLPRQEVRFIASLLSIDTEERYGPLQITPQRHKDETIRCLVELIASVAKRHPAVMLFEDLHWADPSSIEVLVRVIERMKSTPLMLLLTSRPEYHPPWETDDQITILDLPRLTSVQSLKIVAELTWDRPIPVALQEQIVARTDGVPLYVEELTRTLLEPNGQQATETRDLPAASARPNLPATLRDLLTARLDRYPGGREIAQIGSVLGRQFGYALLAAVAPLKRSELDRNLAILVDAGLVVQDGQLPAATFTFKHALVQDAAYDSLLRSHRRELHRRVAEMLEVHFADTTAPEVRAHHLTAAGETARSIPCWKQAGERALDRLAVREAIAHFEQGMALLRSLTPEERSVDLELDLRILLGRAWVALKGFATPEVWDALIPALELAKSTGRTQWLLPIYHGIWNWTLVRGRLGEATDWFEEMLSVARANGDEELELVAHRSACVTLFWRGDFEQSRAHGQLVLECYDDIRHYELANVFATDPKTSVGIYMALGTWMLGYPDRATAELGYALRHSRKRGHPFDLGFALTLSGLLWDLCGAASETWALGEEAEQLGREHRLPFISEIFAPLAKGLSWIQSGQLDEGVPYLKNAISVWQQAGGALIVPYFKAILAGALGQQGNLAAARALLEEAIEQVERPGWGERAAFAEILRLKGTVMLEQGDPAGAEEQYRASLEVARIQNARSFELRTANSLAALWMRQSRHEDSQNLLSPVHEWFSEGLEQVDQQEAKRILAHFAQ